MGNKVCCLDSRTQRSILEQVEQENKAGSNTHQEPKTRQTSVIPQLTQKAQMRLFQEKFFDQELKLQNNLPTKTYGQDVYIGSLDDRNEKPHGLGRMYKPNGSVYIGYFQKGRAQGRGVFIFEDGSYYEGQFDKNIAQSQKGVFKSDLVTIRGCVKDNLFNGETTEEGRDHKFQGWYRHGSREKGTLTWNVEGKKYRYNGDFNHLNQFHGYGTLIDPKGTYQGQFVNGEKEGQGIYRYVNGVRYEGTYKNGLKEGFGTLYDGDNSISYKGELSMGLPHGTGFIYKGDKQMKTTWIEGLNINLLPDKS